MRVNVGKMYIKRFTWHMTQSILIVVVVVVIFTVVNYLTEMMGWRLGVLKANYASIEKRSRGVRS